MWFRMKSQAVIQTQVWILSGPGAFTWCVVLIDLEMEVLVQIIKGGEWYVLLRSGMRGESFGGAFCISHSDVATQVALNKACAFPSLEKLIWPFVTSSDISGEGRGPPACFLVWESVSTIKVDRQRRQESVFPFWIVCRYVFCQEQYVALFSAVG